MSTGRDRLPSTLFEELEPRLLLSADGLAGLDTLVRTDDRDPADTAAQVLPVHQEFSQLQAGEVPPASTEAADRRHEIVFVDGGIEDHETLVAGFMAEDGEQRRIQVVVLDPSEDGIEQITRALAGQTGLDAVHLVSHGDDASLRLGNITLDGNTLERYQDAIAGWANALDSEADLLLYGCNLAASEDGRSLTSTLAALTSADVAASDDLTGSVLLGGDWQLEHTVGVVESRVALAAATQESWNQVLVAYEVTTNAATGPGSLSDAIDQANASVGTDDVITFNIGGGGPQTIVVDAAGLPMITDTVTIDATTQPGYAGDPLITLDGSNTPDGSGINGIALRADNSTVKGFRVHSFADEGLEIDGSTGKGNNNTFQNNWVGIDEAGVVRGNAQHGIIVSVNANNNQIGGTGPNEGNVVAGNGFDRGMSANRYSGIIIRDNSSSNIVEGNIVGLMPDGVTMAGNGENGIVITDSSDDNRIGGTATNAGNVVSGNGLDGIRIDAAPGTADSNVVQGNFIGTDISGTMARGNGDDGISIQGGATNNIIGGTSESARNIISGNNAAGVYLDGATTTGNLIQGNYIGTDINGTADLGNGKISLEGNVRTFDAGSNTIGGTGVGEGNLIAFAGSDGVEIQGTSSGIAILGNVIHSNTGLGIDLLGNNGVTNNDPGDGDGGANSLQNFAVLTSAGTDGSRIAVAGSLNTTGYTTLRIEFFVSDVAAPGNGEGNVYLGSTTTITDASGNSQFLATFDEAVAAGQYITSTATVLNVDGTYGSTSEFSANVQAISALIVDTTDDLLGGNTSSVAALLGSKGADNLISLREAILATNNDASVDVIMLPDGTYTLTLGGAGENAAASGDLDITRDLFLVGSGMGTTVIDGGGDGIGGISTDRVFEVRNGASFSLMDVTLTSGDLPGGLGGALLVGATESATLSGVDVLDSVSSEGGGIFNEGDLYLRDVRIDGNDASLEGGGLKQDGSATLINVTVSGNTSTSHGGGIYEDGTTTLTNVTISGNVTSTGTGGGIHNLGNVSLRNVTIVGNTASSSLAGGINIGGTVSMQNTLIANNTATGDVDISGNAGSLGNNLFGDSTGGSGFHGSDILDVAPALGALADNGGPTPTHALLAGSRGIDEGSATDAPSIDQRGYFRSGAVDIGAYEYEGVNPGGLGPTITSNGGGETASISVPENAVAVTTVTATDPQTDPITYSISGGLDGTLFDIDPGTGVLTFKVAPDFETPTDSDPDNVYEVEVTASDGIGPPDTQLISVTVTNVDEPLQNDAPENTVPGAQTIERGGAVVFASATGTGISVSDFDAAGAAVEVTLTATDGTLTLPSAEGLSFTSGDGIDDAVMVFTGAIADINTALDGMTFVATPGFTGNASVQIVTDDLGNSGPGGAQSDSDSVIVSVVPTDPSLWMTFENDTAATGNPDIPSVSGGDVVTFGGTLTFEPGTTSGTFSYAFDLDSLPASDGDTRVNAVHRVARDTVVGDNAIALLAGDLLLSTDGDETIDGTSYKKEDVFVFRPDTFGDYSSGSVFLLVNGEDFGFGKVTAVSLVESEVVVGGTTLKRGELLIAHDGAKNDIIRFRPGTLGAVTTGTTVRLVDGSDIGIDQKIGALHLVNAPSTVGDVDLQVGQILVALQGDDGAVGDGTPIAVTRQDVFVLDVTATGTGTTAATATALFEGLDEVLNDNSESIWGLSLQRNPGPIPEGAFSIAENVPAGTPVGTVTATDPEGDTPRFAIVGGNTDGAFAIDGATGALTVLNAAAIDHETNATFALQVAGFDDQGSYEVAVVNVTVLNLDEAGINDSPENAVPDEQNIRQDGMVVFSAATANAISVSDFDADVAPIEITITATNGTLNLSGTANLGFTVGDGTANATMTFTGALVDVNTALEGMTFVATPGFSGTASVQIVTNDLGNTGTGGAKSDTDTVIIEVSDSGRALWMTFEDDQAATGNADIPTVTGGDVVSFGGGLEMEPGTTAGTFGYQFNLDAIAGTDGNTRVDALHRVSHDMTVGTNAIALQRGDLLLSTDGDETIGGTTFKEEHVFVFRPTSVDDYSSGSFFLLIDGKDLGFGNVAGVALVERDTVVGDTTLVAGEFLVAHDGATGDLQRVTPGTLGDTTTGTVTRFIDGGDVGIGQKIAGVHLVQNASSLGDLPLTDGQILLSIKSDDNTVGDAPGTIAVTRQDIVLLDVTVTGSDSAATATPLFEGADVALDTNEESIWGVTTEGDAPPVIDDALFAVAENVPATTIVGSVTAIDPEGDAPRYAILAGNVDGAFAIDAVTGQITVANAATMDHETYPEFTLTVAAMDATGGYDTATVRIEIVNLDEAGINDSPVNTVPGTQAITEEGMLVFAGSVGTGVSISDFDAATSPVQVTLTATDGTVTLPSIFGLSFTTGDGSDDAVMTFTGTVADINAALDGMTFTAAANFTGSASLQITTNDLGNTGTGGAKSDTDTVTIQVGDTSQSLWMTFEDDVAVTGNDAIPAVTGGDVVTFGGLLSFEPGTTEGSFDYQFNLDSIAGTDGNTRVSALHRVSRDMTVGSNPIALQRGDLLLSTNEDEVIDGTLYKKDDVFVFRPTSLSDYSAGSFFLLIQGADLGLSKVMGISLVESPTTVGGTPLAVGEILLVHDGAANDLVRFQPGSLGDTTTAAVPLSTLVAGADIDIATKIAGVHLIQSDTTLGEVDLQAGQLLVSLQTDDPIVGDGPSTIDVKRQDIFVLDITATGAGTSAATATRLFEGLDQALDTNQESIWGIALENNATPSADDASFNLDENSATATVVGTVTATDPEGDTPTFAIVAGNTGGAFTIDAATGQITVANSAVLDFETMPVFTLTVAAMDSEGASDTASVTVNLNNTNDNPGGAGSLSTTALNDNVGASSLFGGLSVYDADSGENDLSVTITLSNAAAGSISGGGFTDLGGGVYRATGLTVAQADTALDNVQFTPSDNTGPSGTFNTDISVTVNDQGGGGEQSVLGATTVTITRVNDNPGGAGSLSTTSLNDNAGATALFAGLTVSDVDVGENDLSLTITLTNPAAGTISGGGFTETGVGTGIYTATGLTVAQADTALDNVAFTPTDNTGPSGTFNTDISVTVNDQGGGGEQDVLTATTVTITRVNDNPGGAGSLSTTSLNDNAGATALFAGLTVSDVDAGENDLSLTITLTNAAAGTLSGGGFTETGVGTGIYTVTGLTVAQADTALDNVQFTPTDNTGPSGTFNTDISVTVNDQSGGGEQDVLSATTVTITRVNDNPGGAGSLSTTSLNDNAGATSLFAGLTVSDADPGENDLSLTITLTNAAAGSISGGGFTETGVGTGIYTVTGLTVAQADTALDGVQFTPTDNTGPSGTFNTDISVTVNDQGAGGEQDVLTATTVTITRVNDNPGGAGSLSTTSLNDNAGATALFAGLTVSDVDVGENDLSLTITLTNAAAGSISGGGFTETGVGTGIYTVSGLTTAQADTALDNVTFTPTDNTGPSGTFNTDISVSVNDQGGGGEQDVLTATTVTITRVNDNPGGAGSLSTTSLNDNAGATSLFAGLTVSDVDPGENDLSLTITLTNAAAGTISGGGFAETGVGTGIYTVSGLTTAQADTALDNVTFTPTDNTGPSGTFNTDISVSVNDQGGGGEQDVLTATTVTITRVNDNPGGAGSLSTASLNDNAGATSLFAGLTVSDVDPGENDLSLTITLTNAAAGTISGGGFTETGVGTGIYTVTGLTVAQADTALDNVQFTPTNNTGPSGTFNTDISVTVNDQGGGGEQNVLTSTTVTITRVNDNPGGAGSLSTTALNDNAGATALFAGLTVSDADTGENDLALTITLTNAAAGTISGGGFTETGVGTGIYTVTGLTVAQADTALDNVQFTPTDNTGPSGTFNTDISVTVNDQGGGGEQDVLTATTVTITRVNDNPGGAGSLSPTSLNDNAGATTLFAGLTVSDVDSGENDLSLTITLTNPAAGIISGGGFTETGVGTGIYTVTGLTVAQADTALDNVTFTPTDNTGPSGTFNTDISVTVNDQGGGGEQDVLTATTVTITRVNDNPGGAGSLSTTSLNDNAGATALFAGLTVSDVDPGENDLSLTITLTNAAAGTISGGGFTETGVGTGIYTVTGLTVAQADTALDNVTFTPTDNTGPSGTFNTDISVTVNDQGGGGEQDVLTATTVTITRVNDNPGGAGSLSTTSLNDNAGATTLFAGLTVSDVDTGENDLALTITLTNAAAGSISGGGFTETGVGTGIYTVTGLTVAQADTALDNVQFTPTDNTGPSGTFNTDISVTVNDQGGAGEQDVLTATTVTITRVNDNPGGAGSLSTTALNDNAGATSLFAGLTVSDVDPGENDLALTITLTNASAGTISGGGFTETGVGTGIYTVTGLTVAQADTALDNVQFTPTDNTGPSGTFNTDISVTVNDQGGGGEQSVLSATTVTITRINDNPGGAGSLSTTALNDNAGATALFAGLTVSDVDTGENDLALTITLTNAAAGTISGGGFTETGVGTGIYTATGLTTAQADTALDNVQFTPTDNTGPSGTFNTDISVTVNDQGGGGEQDVLTATTVTITRVNDNPGGVGSLSTTSLNDNAGATNLFAGLSVSDLDTGENDLALTITLTNAAAGSISGGGFTETGVGTGIYTATGLTVAQADTALDNVQFTPTDNTAPSGTFNTDISVTVNDQGGGGEQSVLSATTVTITRVNDNPGGAGSLSTTALNDNAGATALFAGLTVSDVDTGENDLSLTITLTNAAAGTISGGGFTETGVGTGIYTVTGLTVAQADTALDNVQFTPTDNTGPSGTFNTDISVSVNDQGGGGEQSVLSATTVTITRVNDNPGGAGSLSTTSLNDNAGATALFAGLTVSDVDVGENDLSLTITLTNAAAGTISGGGFTETGVGTGIYTATGLTVAQADTALDNVTFTPTDNTGPSGTFNTDISVTVNDQGGGGEQSVLSATTVTITRVNDNPGGAGSLSTTALNDNAGATALFAGLTVSDVDTGENDLSLTITLTNAAAGTISGGGFTETGVGTGIYTVTGLTVAQADTALDNVTFTPTNNTGPSGTFNTDISVSVNDQGGGGEQSVLGATTVTITRVNDNPGGAGSLSTTSLNDNAGATALFAGLTVSDVDTGENDLSLTITLTNAAAGTISGGGFTETGVGTGIYIVTGLTTAQADTALDNATFTPTDNTGPSGTFNTDISVTVNDQGGGGEQSVLSATTVTVTRVNDNPGGAGSLSTTSLNDNAGSTALFAGLTVSDVDTGENDLALTITLTNAAAGTISGGGFTETGVGTGIYTVIGLTVAQADTALDNVQFTPTDNTGPSGTFNTDISVTVNDQGGGGEQSVLSATTVTITRVNDNPGGAGSLSTTSLNDNAGATALFAGLTVSDVDSGENDLSLTITLTNAAAGTISGGGFTETGVGTGIYTVTGLTVAQADTALDNATFTPTDNTGPSGTFNTDISVSVNDQGGGGEQSVLSATTVTITRVNDNPGGAGSLSTTSLNDNAGATALFAGLTVSDVDVGENDLSLTITLTNAAAGTISGGGFTETGVGTGIYTVTGLTVAQADTALDNVQFTPTNNTGPSGTFATDISVTVNDQGGGGEQSVLSATTVTITRVNDNPAGAGSLSTTSLNDNAGATALFAGLTVSDVDTGEADLALTITLTNAAAGTLAGGGFTETGVGTGIYTVTGLTTAQADTALDNVQFTPTDNTGPSGTFNTDISVTVNDQGGGGEQSVLSATTVTITRVNDNPAGAGSLSTTSLNDNAGATALFAGLTVSDVDVGENDLSLTITLTNAAAGTVAGGGFTDLGGGVYRATGLTVTQADTALDNVTFTPTNNTGPSGTFATDISVTVNDQGGGGEQSVLSATTVTITRVNDNPGGAGSLSTTALNDNAGPTALFAGLTVSDVDAGEVDLALTITLTNPTAGTISGGGFVDLGGGVYRATGLTVAQADTALDDVRFTPTNNTGPSGTFNTDISVTVNDQGGGGEQSVLGPTTVTITRVNEDPTGAGSLSTTSLNDDAGAINLFAGLTVSDEDTGENDLALTIRLTNPSAATISGGGFVDLGAGAYRASGLTVAQANSALDNVRFVPTEDNSSPDVILTTDISVTVNDQGGGGEQNVLNSTTVTITRLNLVIPEEAEGLPPPADTQEESGEPPLDELTLSAVLAPVDDDRVLDGATSEDVSVDERFQEGENILQQVVALMDAAIIDDKAAPPNGEDGPRKPKPEMRMLLLEAFIASRQETMHMSLPDIVETNVSSGEEEALIAELTRMQSDMVANGEEQVANEVIRQGVIKSAVGTLSVGSVSWLLRAGTLLTGVFSSIPMWGTMDPLPVLSASDDAKKRKRGRRADPDVDVDDDDSEQRMGRILDRPESISDSRGTDS